MEKPKNIQYHYFTFPIVLLKILHEDHRSFADNAICWTVYNYAETKLHGLPERERVEKALSKYGVSTEDLAGWIRHAKTIHRSIEGSKVLTSITKDILFDFLENDKSDAEVNELLMFAALRSIIGKKQYCKITKDYLFSRMAGEERTVKDLDQLPDRIKALSGKKNEYQFNKVRASLRHRWGLKIYSRRGVRGWYATFKPEWSLKRLAKHIELKLESNREKKYRAELKAAQSEALTTLFGPGLPSNQ